MKRNHLLVLFAVLLTTILSCKKKEKVDIDLNNSKQPEITGFTPGHGVPGTIVTITGKNFSTNIPDNKVFLGTQQMVVTEATATALKFRVPFLSVSGKIKVENGNLSATTANSFTVDPLPDGIMEITPLEGPFATEVTINGANFPLSPEVKINGVKCDVKSSSASRIVVTIPYDTELTKHKIVVTGDGKTFESPQEFTVTAPGKYAEWVKLTDPGATPNTTIYSNGIAFVHNNRIYWGFTPMSTFQDEASFHMYDPAAATKQWVTTFLDTWPAEMQNASVAVVGNKAFIGNGLPHNTLGSKWWAFDIPSGAYQQVKDFPVAEAGFGIAFNFKGTMYAGAGAGNKDIYGYDPAGANGGTWTKALTPPYAQIDGGAAVVLDNEVILGRALKQLTDPRVAMFKFTVANGTAQIAQLPDLPDGGQLSALSGPSFAMGGKAYFVINKRVWEYDPAPARAANPYRMVLQSNETANIRHVFMLNNKVTALNNKGQLYEFKFRD